MSRVGLFLAALLLLPTLSAQAQLRAETTRSLALQSPAPQGASDADDRAGRHRIVLGTLHLTVGVIGLGGGTAAGIGAYSLTRNANTPGEETAALGVGLLLGTAAVALIGTGVWMTVRGIRILRGDSSPHRDEHPSPPRLSLSGSSLTLSF